MTKIKICGIQSFQDVDCLNETSPDFAGFVFAPGRRQIDCGKAFLLRSELRKEIRTVGVFVNAEIDQIRQCCEAGIIDLIQLHGNEKEDYVRRLRQIVPKPLIRAIRVGPGFDAGSLSDFQNGQSPLYDYPLFDTLAVNAYGGTGISFDWSLVQSCRRPFFLAGGLGADNVGDAVRAVRPYGVDLSSKAESEGKKDIVKIREIIRAVRSVAGE